MAAIATQNVTAFNIFLSEQIKQVFSRSSRHKKFWEDLRADGIRPISSEEAPSSTVSKRDADTFYDEAVVDLPSSAPVTTGNEDDDMFDNLE